MVFGFFGSGAAKEDKARLDAVQALIDEHREDAGDTDLDLFANAAKDLRKAMDVEIAGGAKHAKVLIKIEQLSDGILNNLENRINPEMLELNADGPKIADRCAQIAKDLDAVRATKASTLLISRTEGMQEKLASDLLVKVKEAYAEIQKTPTNVLQNVRDVIAAVEGAHAKAPTGKKVSEQLMQYCVQLASALQKGMVAVLQADPTNGAVAKRVAENLDSIAEKLAAALGAKWDPAAAVLIETTVDDCAKQVFSHNAKLIKEEGDKGADMTFDAAQQVRQILTELQPWWIIAADIEVCSSALQEACASIVSALVEVFKVQFAAACKDACDALLNFAGELDTVTAKFDGIAVADSSVRSQMMDATCSDVPEKLDALDVELEKEELEVATLVMALKIMEGLEPLWATIDDALKERVKSMCEAVEAKVLESVSLETGSSFKALQLFKNAEKYEKLCTVFSLGSDMDGKNVQKTMAPLVAKSCLQDAEEEISKTEGVNPKAVMKALEAFQTPMIKDTIVEDEDVKARLLVILRATEERLIMGFKKSIAAQDQARMQAQAKFAGEFSELSQDIEPDIPDGRHSLKQMLELFVSVGSAEKQVALGPDMDCAKVNKAFDCVTDLCSPPKSPPEEVVERMQAFFGTLRPALFARTIKAGEDRMVYIVECAQKAEICMAVVEQRDAEESSELCQALTCTKDVNRSLATLDEELSKEKGMNPMAVLRALQALKESWAPVAAVSDFELRLVSIFALLEDRMCAACQEALADGNLGKAQRLMDFSSSVDEVQECAEGEAKLCEKLAGDIVTHLTTVAETELDKEEGMHPKKVLDALGQLAEFWPKLVGGATSDALESNHCVSVRSFDVAVVDTIRSRLVALRDVLVERMGKALGDAMTAEEERKIKALIKFACEFDSVFASLDIEGSIAEPLESRANGEADPADPGIHSHAAPDDSAKRGGALSSALDEAHALLMAMKSSDLQKLARSLGISEDERDAALDSDDPKTALVDLVFNLQKPEIEAEEAKKVASEEADAAKRDELKEMKNSDLQKLARSLEIGEDARDAALDADDPQAALIELVFPLYTAVGPALKAAAEAEEAQTNAAAEAEQTKREELNAMKKSDLQKLAGSLGVSEDASDEALDADNPQEALIELILPLYKLVPREEEGGNEAG